MHKFLFPTLFLASLAGCTATTPPIATGSPSPEVPRLRFDGLYVAAQKDCYSYLRFYRDGLVADVSSTGRPEDVNKWIGNWKKGKFTLDGDALQISTRFQGAAAINYSGTVHSDSLMLQSYSHFNESRWAEIYRFMSDADAGRPLPNPLPLAIRLAEPRWRVCLTDDPHDPKKVLMIRTKIGEAANVGTSATQPAASQPGVDYSITHHVMGVRETYWGDQRRRDRPATRRDWDAGEMPKERAVLPLKRHFSEDEMVRLRWGVVPRAMEDHWFIFFETDCLYFVRSWTGICVYTVEIKKRGGEYVAIKAEANRSPALYKESKPPSVQADTDLLSWLIDGLLGRATELPRREPTTQRDEAVATSQPAAGLDKLVGQGVTLTGTFGGPGKTDDYIRLNANERVYFEGKVSGLEPTYGQRIRATGVLRYDPGSGPPPPHRAKEPTSQPAAARYFFDAAQIAAADLPATQPATQPVAFDVHDSYFVSNKFQPDAPASFVVLKDQKAFDAVFGVGFVMGDNTHRLPANAFDKKMVVAAIHRGKAVWTYKVESVTEAASVLTIRYTETTKPSDSAELACPLIVSVPRGDYRHVEFVVVNKGFTATVMRDGNWFLSSQGSD